MTVRAVNRTRVVGVALTVVALHLVVLTLLTSDSSAALAAFAWILLSPIALRLFASGERLTRVVVTVVPGFLAATPGIVTHLGRTAVNGPSATDFTGVAAGLAGLVLLGVAAESAFRGTRRGTKLLAIPLALVVLQFYVLPVLVTGTIATNGPRAAPAAAATLGIAGAADVRFRASDGVGLAGWFVPGRSSAAVIVLHGSHGTRASATPWIRMLHDAGFSVLAYDARGHGASGGHENAYGWNGDRDVAGAVAWLRGHAGIDARRIGALGLSMGAEEALRAAARDSRGLRAVVADGAGASTLGDIQLQQADRSPLFSAVTWLGMRSVELFSGDSEPPALGSVVARISRPVLLIASNRSGERRIGAAFRERMGPRAALWYVPDAGHTRALARHPAEYRARVTGFLQSALR